MSASPDLLFLPYLSATTCTSEGTSKASVWFSIKCLSSVESFCRDNGGMDSAFDDQKSVGAKTSARLCASILLSSYEATEESNSNKCCNTIL